MFINKLEMNKKVRETKNKKSSHFISYKNYIPNWHHTHITLDRISDRYNTV